MPQNSIELLQKLMEKYSRVFMSFAGKQGVPYDDVEDIVMASFWSCYKGENCQYIRDTIDGLKDIWREPVRMYFIEERSIPEISRALGITEEVCRSRISRARKCLKEKLKGLWEQFQ